MKHLIVISVVFLIASCGKNYGEYLSYYAANPTEALDNYYDCELSMAVHFENGNHEKFNTIKNKDQCKAAKKAFKKHRQDGLFNIQSLEKFINVRQKYFDVYNNNHVYTLKIRKECYNQALKAYRSGNAVLGQDIEASFKCREVKDPFTHFRRQGLYPSRITQGLM